MRLSAVIWCVSVLASALLLRSSVNSEAVEERVTQAYVIDGNHIVMQKLLKNSDYLSTLPLCYYKVVTNQSMPATITSNLTWAEYEGVMARQNRRALTVQFAMQLLQITDVSEREQTISMVVYTTTMWMDCRLRWTKQESDVPALDLTPHKFRKLGLFAPSMRLLEATNPQADEGSETLITIFQNGEVSLSREFAPVVSCNIDVRMYPFDVQTCVIKFESTIEDRLLRVAYQTADSVAEESNYLLGSDRYVASDTWVVTLFPPVPFKRHVCVDAHDNHSDCYRGGLKYTLVLRRYPTYQLLNLVLPAFLVVIISSCVFVMPPGSGDKMELSITILLSIFMFTQLMYEKMPDTGAVVPILSEFFMICIGLVGCSCMFSAFNSVMENANPNVPFWLKRVVRVMAPILMHDLLRPNRHGNRSRSRSSRNRTTVSKSVETALLSSPAAESQLRESPEASNDIDADSGVNITGNVGFNINHPDEIGWKVVSVLADRLFFVAHLSTMIAILGVFLSWGFSNWYSFGKYYNTTELLYVCEQLKMQRDPFAPTVCQQAAESLSSSEEIELEN